MPEVKYLVNDECWSLMVKGDYSKSEVIKMAIEQNVIDNDYPSNSEYYQYHVKAVPHPEYSTYYHGVKSECKGSFFASWVLFY